MNKIDKTLFKAACYFLGLITAAALSGGVIVMYYLLIKLFTEK